MITYFSLDTLSHFGGCSLKIFVDGELIDTFDVPKEPKPGDEITTPLLNAALKGREITDVSFVGTMVIVTSRPEIAETD
jgi:hypothetical protein